MKRPTWHWLIGGLLLFAVGGVAWWFFFARGGGESNAAKPDGGDSAAPVAQVKVIPARRGTIERTLTVYGTAIAAPGGTRSISFPYECRVVAVQANPGQPVATGDTLLQIEPSADARLALDTAKSAGTAAQSALKDVQGRYKLKLATNQELATAESAARDANLKLASLQARGPGPDGQVRASASGVVTKVDARPGAVVPAGSPLIELAVESRLEARLGVAPPDAGEVKTGQAVHLEPVEPRAGNGGGAPPAFSGTVRVVGQSVDLTTRLVDVFAALDEPDAAGDAMLIGTYLRAGIGVEKKEALLAPRAAVLPNARGDAATLFTVKNGKAVKHEIHTGIDDGTEVEVLPNGGGDAGLKAGDDVVIQGNYELEDGMAVKLEPPGATTAAKGAATP